MLSSVSNDRYLEIKVFRLKIIKLFTCRRAHLGQCGVFGHLAQWPAPVVHVRGQDLVLTVMQAKRAALAWSPVLNFACYRWSNCFISIEGFLYHHNVFIQLVVFVLTAWLKLGVWFTSVQNLLVFFLYWLGTD